MQLGTLGSGNHFLELQSVESIHDHEAARAFGIAEGSLVAMIHSGSRGLGHQVCSESVQEIEADHIPHEGGVKHRHHGHVLPDRQLAAAPINSIEGQAYLGAMRSAANFAFANRSVLSHRLRDVLTRNFGMDGEARVVYDVAHNIAKEEVHSVHGSNCVCCVHRKGATRAFPGDSLELAEDFRGIGQPVLVPGDMGRASWILAGPKEGANQAYSSSCHGAGRQLSRTAARKSIDVAELKLQLQNDGVEVRAKTARLLSEEAPNAYKDVDEVIRMTVGAELARPVARMRPLIVVKG